MNLQPFFQFNQTCPVCQNPLSLYLQWHYSTTWKADKITNDEITFRPFKLIAKDIDPDSTLTVKNNGDNNTVLQTDISAISDKEMYLFYLCNERAFVDKGQPAYDWELSVYHCCYFRSSIDLRLDANRLFVPSNADHLSVINGEETLRFKDERPEVENIYVLCFKNLDNNIRLWHYSATPTQMADDNYEPKLFEKELPALLERPSFDPADRASLIDRFATWVNFS